MKTKKRIYCDISKVEQQEDGTLTVSGYASSGAVDSDGETVTPDAMKAALPDYMKFGAVREMHQSSAAGTALHAEVQEDGRTAFSAHVVDPVAVKKVQTGVYKGFSIGGKVTERDATDRKIIKGLNLIEISLVDRPANPEALMTMYKAERTEEDDAVELAEMIESGAVSAAQMLVLAKAATTSSTPLVPGVELVPPALAKSTQEEGTGATGGTPLKGGDAPLAPDASPNPAANVKKGMYSVSDFSSILSALACLVSDASWEAQYEGDDSPIPAQLVAWIKTGTDIFRAMAAEETEEMLASLREAAGVTEVLVLAAPTGDVAKAGAKFSTTTKAALGDVHKAMQDCCAKMDALGYKDADDSVESAAAVITTKAAGGDTNGIGLETQVGELVKAAMAPLNESLEKLGKENSELKGQLEELKKRAAPAKALLKHLSVGKGHDASPVTDPAEKAENIPAEGTLERANYEMRKVFSTGQRLV